MYDFFDEFFPIGFRKPERFYFNTNGLKDQMPSQWQKTDYGYRAVVKVLGIEKAKVEVIRDKDYGESYIKCHGESEIDGMKFNTSVELPVVNDVLANVKKIKHKTIAGICFIDLYVEQPKEEQILIEEE